MLSLLSLAFVFAMSTWFSATAVVSQMQASLNVTEAVASLFTVSVQAGFVVGALAAALLNLPDRIALNRLIGIACLLAGFVNLLLVVSPNVTAVVALRFFNGVFLAAIYPPAMKLVATWFLRWRGLAIGAAVGALCVGSGLPHLFRGLFAAADWRLVIVLTSVSSFFAAFLFLLVIREGPLAPSRASFELAHLRRITAEYPVVLLNIGYLGHMWELYALWAWIAVYLRASVVGEQPEAVTVSLSFAVFAVGGIGCLLGGFMSDRIGRLRTIRFSLAVSGACALAIGFLFDGPSWLLIVVVLVWGLAVIADSPIYSAAMTELVDSKLAGTALSIQMAMGYALTMLSIHLVPVAVDWLGGWRWGFVLLAAGPGVAFKAIGELRNTKAAARISSGG